MIPSRTDLRTVSGMRHVAITAAVAVICVVPRTAVAQDCPTAKNAKRGFVVERNERQKSEIFHDNQGIVCTVMRYDGKTLLETTQYEGLFQLDRLDRGKRTKYEPASGADLRSLFPLKPGQHATAKFITESNGQYGRLYVELDVKSAEDLFIGPCKYKVLRIERGESSTDQSPRFPHTEFYSPELKLIVARQYKKGDGREMIKYDRIYTSKN